ncbi:uncharacterized protein LOC116345119 [Contarinia nasturtii]|uniref:uncharacterized protein LOC116345119 n=1 Tax=Contarinia nasturtii TaxID=265458 RepID=UPI0012D4587D|nr:uncharacterized protein LOC116345119 [Contarinia nasturtii]
MMMTFNPFRPNGLQFIFGLICLIEALQICLSWVSASSSDMLIIRHGRSRVRHSTEKNHIRWGLQAFDNLTLYDYDYETNGTNGSNETLFGDFGLNGANQTFSGGESFGYFSSEMVFNNVSSNGSNNTNINSDSKLLSTLAPSLASSNRWSASTLSTPSKNQKLAKKQIMENIRKNVEEGIEYLRTHAHLTQPTAVMPSEKALLQLQKQAEKLTHETEKQQQPKQKQRTRKIEIHNESSQSQEIGSFSSTQTNSMRLKSSSSPSLPSSLGLFYHPRIEHNQSNHKKHKTNIQLLQWKTHQIQNEDDGKNVADDEIIGNNRFTDHNLAASNHFDYEIQNDEPNNENIHQHENHPYKSNKLNKSNPRHAHEPSSVGRSNGIATIKAIDSIVAAVSKKYLDQAINNSGNRTNLNGNSNATKANLRSQSNSKMASRLQSANEKRKDTHSIGHTAKISDIPISSVASLVSQQHNIDSDMTKPNDSTQSKVKSNANLNNQYETNNGFYASAPSASAFDDNELNDEQQSEFSSDDSGIDDPNTMFTFDEQTINIDGKTIDSNDIIRLPVSDLDLDDLDEISRNNRLNLQRGRDVVTKFLQIVESQHHMGANCTAGTALNLGEGVVDRYAQDRFQIEAEVAVNRANMLTRIFKLSSRPVQMSEHILHASVLSMVEFDDDIYAAGHCFDWNQHLAKKGLFCPFAHRLPPPDQLAILVKDLASEYPYLGNTSEWFFLARKNAEKVIAKNEQYTKAFHLYSNSTERETDEILSVKYEDGRWSKPYYDCGGANIWMLTYTVPFFGYENGTYFFKGTSGIDIDLRRVDIDQCPQRQVAPGGVALPLNIFAGTDKCKARTTQCEPISGLGFRRGSYKCVCRKGFYFPDTNLSQKYFNGSTLEEEYEKLMLGEMSLYNNASTFECLPCAEGCDACKDASPCVAALNWTMRTSILVLACAVIGFLPPAAYFTFRYQQVKVLRAASPALLRVIALGAFFIYCTSIVMYPRPSIYTCTARVWLREIGFSLTYGALMLKTWRISVVFRVRSAKAVKITDATLLKRLGIICICVTIGLLVRTIVAPPVVIVGRTADDLKAFLCKADWWDHTFTSMEVLFLAWGVRLCIMVRKAPSEFNESRFISMAIYNEFFLTCFLNVSMLFLQSPANPDLLYIIFFCHTQLTVTLLLALIFGSKVYLVFRSGGKPPEDSGVKSSGAKFICRSQARPIGNAYPSTATSSTTPLGTNIEHRLTDQEANDEIRSLLQNFIIQLQSVKDRVPSRGSAMATISILLDTTKPLSNLQMSLMPPTLAATTAIKKPAFAIHNSTVDKSTNTNTIATTSNGGTSNHLTHHIQMQPNQKNGSITTTMCSTQISITDTGCDKLPDIESISVSGEKANELPEGSIMSEKHNQNENTLMDATNCQQTKPKTDDGSDKDGNGNDDGGNANSGNNEHDRPELNFLNLKLQCMCSSTDVGGDSGNVIAKPNVNAISNRVSGTIDDETEIEISDVEAVTEIGESIFENHRCTHCGRGHCCFFLRCCYCTANGVFNESDSMAIDAMNTNQMALHENNPCQSECDANRIANSNNISKQHQSIDSSSSSSSFMKIGSNQNLASKRCDEICEIIRNQYETGLCNTTTAPLTTTLTTKMFARKQCCEESSGSDNKHCTNVTKSIAIGCHCRWYCIQDCDLDAKSTTVVTGEDNVDHHQRLKTETTTLAVEKPEIVSPITNESPLNDENRLRCCRCSKELF